MDQQTAPPAGPLALAVDTSGRHGSVAIGRGDRLLAEIPFSGAMRHGAELLPAVQDLLGRVGGHPAGIQHIYITAGPGSFTGLRIGLSLAKMLAFTHGAQIVSVDTLDVLAANVLEFHNGPALPDRLACILDAKRGEFFVAIFRKSESEFRRETDDLLISAERFVEEYVRPGNPVALLGEGLVYYAKKFQNDSVHILPESTWHPKARHVYRLGREKAQAGEFSDPVGLVPLYLRGPDALEKWQRKLS